MTPRSERDAGTAYAVAAVGIAGLVFFVFLAFVSLGLTVMCLLAWKKPFTLGAITITPHEAHRLVGWGAGGAMVFCKIGAPVLAVLSGEPVSTLMPWMAIAGYTCTSLGFAAYCAKKQEAEEEQQILPPPPMPAPPTPARPQIVPHAPPFRFASWDDEEVRK